MKTLSSWIAVVGMGMALVPSVMPANSDPVAPASTNSPAAKRVAVAPPPLAAPAEGVPVLPAGISTNIPVPSIKLPPVPVGSDEVVIATVPKSPATEPGDDTRRRLEPLTPEQLIEKYGSIGFVVRQPEPRNFFEIINPFAPASYGVKRKEIYNRDPNLKPGAMLPRTFVRDGIRNEPEMNLLGWPW